MSVTVSRKPTQRGQVSRPAPAPAPSPCVLEQCPQLARLVDEMPQGMLIVSKDGLLIHANPAAEAMLSPLRLQVGRALAALAEMEAVSALAFEAMRKQDRAWADLRVPSNASGHLCHVVAMPWDEAGSDDVLLMLEDVKASETTANQLREYIASSCHELRTPLSLIHGYLETLREGVVKNPASMLRCLEVMDRHSRRLMRIIDDMLFLARIEGDSAFLKPAPLLARGCVEDALEQLTPLLDLQQVKVSLDFPAEGGVLHGDRTCWDQVFTNLVEHVLRTNSRPGLRVKISGHWSEDECLLSVEHDGPGIPASELPYLFERFPSPQHGQSQEIRGGGLGLCTVKLAVEAHGGTIRVESSPDKRTAFVIRVPLRG